MNFRWIGLLFALLMILTIAPQTAHAGTPTISDIAWSYDGTLLATVGYSIIVYDRFLIPLIEYDEATSGIHFSSSLSWHPTEPQFVTDRFDRGYLDFPTSERFIIYDARLTDVFVEAYYTEEELQALGLRLNSLTWVDDDTIYVDTYFPTTYRLSAETLQIVDELATPAITEDQRVTHIQFYDLNDHLYVAYASVPDYRSYRNGENTHPTLRVMDIISGEMTDTAFPENTVIGNLSYLGGHFAVEIRSSVATLNYLALVDVQTNTISCRFDLNAMTGGLSDMSWRFDNRYLAYISLGGQGSNQNWVLTVVDAESCESAMTLSGDESLYQIAWHPDGTVIAASTWGGELQLIDVSMLLESGE
ncbi:MAG: hypothetical protein RLP44_30950 [Aggregatilineales bacterium]